MSKYCSQCGAELPDDAKFCKNCGSKQEEKNNKTIIIIALATVIAVLAIAVIMTSSENGTQMEILTESLTVNDDFSVKLTCNGNGIGGEPVSIHFKGSKMNYEYTAATDSDGIATVTANVIDDDYTVTCEFEGNEKYAPSNATSRISVEPDYMSYSFTPTFEDTDTDGDGYVVYSDFNMPHTPREVSAKIFDDSDDNADGRLDKYEYHKFMYKLNYERTEYGLDDVKLPV